MVSTRASASGTSKRKTSAQDHASISDAGKSGNGQDTLQDIARYIDKLRVAASKLIEELERLQEKNKELEDELATEKEATALSTHAGRGSTPATIKKLEATIKQLTQDNKKKNRIIAKMKAKELKAEAEDLMDTVPDPETEEDRTATMRKLLRRFSDLMLVTTLGDDEECTICMDPMELNKCSAFSCGHLICDVCLKQILPKDEIFKCHLCRKGTVREEIEQVHMTETARWDDLLKVAAAWDAFDHRPNIETSEEEEEENFITDASGDDEISSEGNVEDRGDAADASGGETNDQEEEPERMPTPSSSSPPPTRLPYSASPTKEKRKRLAELATERESKRRR